MVVVKTASGERSFKPINPPKVGTNGYEGFQPGKVEILKKGHSKKAPWGDEGKPLKCDIILEHDVQIQVRDGTKIYGDIYRPAHTDEKVPCILGFGPYGKKFSGHGIAQHLPWHCGLKASDMSGYETFECVDPAEFCNWGYAVAAVDCRGSVDSEGYIEIMSEQDSQDGYDIIEFLGRQDWCNGAVGMAGNSHLAIVQYFVAAQQPPSLKAIAPWEACSDLAREQFTRGGIFYISNNNFITKFIIQGKNGYEDFEEMYEKNPLAGPYWDSKRAPLEKIKQDMPVFITGSDMGGMHPMGSVRGYVQIPSKNKWIKWNPYHEWYDIWAPEESREELREFFDRYLKGKDNGWEKTPRCRWSLLQYGDKAPIENIAIPDFPHPDTKYTTLHLTPEGQLALEAVKEETTLSYDSESPTDRLLFNIKFDKTTNLLGIPKIYLHMSCDDHDDMNVYVQIRKIDKNGVPLVHIPFPKERWEVDSMYDLSEKLLGHGMISFKGQNGMLRASHRKIDRSKTWHPQIPFHPHDEFQRIPKGEVVELEIGMFPGAVRFDAGESLSVQLFGYNGVDPELQHMNRERPHWERNHGKHFVHFGEKYDNRIILPFVELEL